MTRGKVFIIIIINYPKFLRFRITEGLLYYNEINCKWKSFLECCVRFVAYRVKSNFYAVGVSGCVSISNWFREGDVKNYKKILAVISYVRSVCKELLSECLAVSTPLQANQIIIFLNTHHSITFIWWELYIIKLIVARSYIALHIMEYRVYVHTTCKFADFALWLHF